MAGVFLREALEGFGADEHFGAVEALEARGEGGEVVEVGAEHEVAVFGEELVGGAEGEGGGGVGEAFEVALEEEAEVAKMVGEGGVVLNGAHALGVGEDDGEAEGLEAADGGVEEGGEFFGPEVDEDVFAGEGVGDEVVRGGVGGVGAEVDFAAGEEGEMNADGVQGLLELVGAAGDHRGDGVVGEARPDVWGAEGVGVAGGDEHAGAGEGFFEGAAAVVHAGDEVGVDVDLLEGGGVAGDHVHSGGWWTAMVQSPSR